MFTLMMQGGPFMWIILIIAIVNIILTVKKALDLYVKHTSLNPYELKRGIHAILFWGLLGTLLGYMAHYLGVYQAMLIISRAKEISPMIIAEGYAQSLLTIKFGMIVLFFSAIAWGWLISRQQKLQQRNI